MPADIQVGPATRRVPQSRRWLPWVVTAMVVGFVIINWADKALLGGIIADRTSLRWVLFTMSALWSLTSLPVLLGPVSASQVEAS